MVLIGQAFGDTLMALIVRRSDSFTNVAIVPCAPHTAGDLQQL